MAQDLAYPAGAPTGAAFGSLDAAVAWLNAAIDGQFGDFTRDGAGTYFGYVASGPSYPSNAHSTDAYLPTPPVDPSLIVQYPWIATPVIPSQAATEWPPANWEEQVGNVILPDGWRLSAAPGTPAWLFTEWRLMNGYQLMTRAAIPSAKSRAGTARVLGDCERATEAKEADFVTAVNRWVQASWVDAYNDGVPVTPLLPGMPGSTRKPSSFTLHTPT